MSLTLDNAVKPLYNRHFKTSYFFAAIKRFFLSEIKNILATPVVTKIFVLIMKDFSIVSLIWRVC